SCVFLIFFFFQAEDGIRDATVTGVQTCALPISAPPTPPSAPTNLTATAGNAQVAVTWTASTGATSYNVKRSTTSGSGYVRIGTSTAAAFTDMGLTNGTTYYYVVSGVNASGEGTNSSQVTATPVSAAADVTITIDPTKTNPISPYIYGNNSHYGVYGSPIMPPIHCS